MNNTTKALLTALLVLAFITEYTIKGIVALVALTTLAIEGAVFVYNNRREIMDTIGEPFVYYSPARLTAPQRIRYARPKNTLRYASA